MDYEEMEMHFLGEILTDNTDIMVMKPSHDLTFTFSNSGRGGKRNWFTMKASQLIITLEDIIENVDQFPLRYEEKKWRELFALYLNDDVARTMGAVQTLPLFEILAKIIHYANEDSPRIFKTIDLEPAKIRNAIILLKSTANV